MNETGHNPTHAGGRNRAFRADFGWGTVAVALVVVGLAALFGGCADPRNEPFHPSSPAYTETIVLWNYAVTSGQRISGPFTVAQPLANRDALTPTPARLTVVAYIRPDSSILRRELITDSLIPDKADQIVGLLVLINGAQGHLDTLHYIDSLCHVVPDCGYDTTGISAEIAAMAHQIDTLNAEVDTLVDDTTELGAERDSLGLVLDDRFNLALWMDQDTAEAQAVYPEAIFRDAQFTLGGQQIYLAATDSATYMKGRGFRLAMDRFLAADPLNYNLQIELNWTGRLSEGPHTLYGRVTGEGSRITGSLMLVYAEERP